MTDIIRDKKTSECRFLRISNKKVNLTKLGMGCMYVLGPVANNVEWFGKSGTADGQSNGLTGMVVDDAGKPIVADSRKHRLSGT